MDEDASGVPHSSHMPSGSFGNSLLPGMQGMGGGLGVGMGSGMPGLGSGMSGMPGMGGGMQNMSGMNMGLSSEMERRAEDGTDFSHFGDESNKGNELGLDSEPQGTGGPKPRKHFRGFQRKPEANLLLLKAVLKHQPFKHGNVGPGWAAVTAEINSHTDLFAGEETGCTVDTCRNTYERLVESWFKHDRRESSFCGPEYDYTEWNEARRRAPPISRRGLP